MGKGVLFKLLRDLNRLEVIWLNQSCYPLFSPWTRDSSKLSSYSQRADPKQPASCSQAKADHSEPSPICRLLF